MSYRTFIRKTKSIAKDKMKQQISIEPFSKPSELKPGMLIRVKWDDKWYSCRYLTQADGSAVAYSFIDQMFTPIDLNLDEWTYEEYPPVQTGDQIEIEEIDRRVQAKWNDIDVYWDSDDAPAVLLLPHTIKDDAPKNKTKPMIPQEEVLHGTEPRLALVQSVSVGKGEFSYRIGDSRTDSTCLVWYERYRVIIPEDKQDSEYESSDSSDEEDEIIVQKDGKKWYVNEGVTGGETKQSSSETLEYTLIWVKDPNVTKSITKSEYKSLLRNLVGLTPKFKAGDKVYSSMPSKNGKDFLVATVVDVVLEERDDGEEMFHYRVKIKDKKIQKMWEKDMHLKIPLSLDMDDEDRPISADDLSSDDSSSEEEEDEIDKQLLEEELFNVTYTFAHDVGSKVIILSDQVTGWILRAPPVQPWNIIKREADDNFNVVYTLQRDDMEKKEFHGNVDVPSEDNLYRVNDIVQLRDAPSWGLFRVDDADGDTLTLSVSPISSDSVFETPSDASDYQRQVLGRASAKDGLDMIPQILFEISDVYESPPEDEVIELSVPYGGLDKYIMWEDTMYELKQIVIQYIDKKGKKRNMVWGNNSEAYGTLLMTRCIFKMFSKVKSKQLPELIIEHREPGPFITANEYFVRKVTKTDYGEKEDVSIIDGWPETIIYDKDAEKEEEGEFDEIPSDEEIE